MALEWVAPLSRSWRGFAAGKWEEEEEEVITWCPNVLLFSSFSTEVCFVSGKRVCNAFFPFLQNNPTSLPFGMQTNECRRDSVAHRLFACPDSWTGIWGRQRNWPSAAFFFSAKLCRPLLLPLVASFSPRQGPEDETRGPLKQRMKIHRQ